MKNVLPNITDFFYLPVKKGVRRRARRCLLPKIVIIIDLKIYYSKFVVGIVLLSNYIWKSFVVGTFLRHLTSKYNR